MSLWKKISLGVLVVILLLLGTVAFWWGQPPVCIWSSAANRCARAGDRSGHRRLAGFITENIRYDQPGVAVNAGEVHLAVGLNCLWNSSLCVNDLSLKNINVAIDSKNAAISVGGGRRERSA